MKKKTTRKKNKKEAIPKNEYTFRLFDVTEQKFVKSKCWSSLAHVKSALNNLYHNKEIPTSIHIIVYKRIDTVNARMVMHHGLQLKDLIQLFEEENVERTN